MKPTPKVALLVETSNSYARELLHGVRAWVREHGPWSIRLTERGRGAGVVAAVGLLGKGDGGPETGRGLARD